MHYVYTFSITQNYLLLAVAATLGPNDSAQGQVIFSDPTPGADLGLWKYPAGPALAVTRRGVRVRADEFKVGDFITIQMSPNGLIAECLTPNKNLDDASLRAGNGGGYKVEFAWGGNKLQNLDENGLQKSSVLSCGPLTPSVTYAPQKAIDGNRSPWDYSRDIKDDFFKLAYPESTSEHQTVWQLWLSLSCGQQTDFNEVVVYFAPDTFPHYLNGVVQYWPGAMRFELYGSNSNTPSALDPSLSVTWTKISAVNMYATFDWTRSQMKAVVRFPTTQSFKHISILCFRDINLFIDSVSITQIELYNFVDETQNLVWADGTGPRVDITKSSESSQVAVPTVSDCQITLDNTLGRFNPGNSASPIYGNIQYDGRGDGIRQGVPVRVMAELTDANGIWRGEQVFDGFILNDDGSSGPQAVQTDTGSYEALFVCKGITALMQSTFNTPAYEGCFLDYCLRDIFDRSGVPMQDCSISNIKTALEWVALDSTSAIDVVRQLKDALPYLEISEEHNPAAISIRNRGSRTRAHLDFSRFKPGLPDFGQNTDTVKRFTDYGCCVSTVIHYGKHHIVYLNRAVLAYYSLVGDPPYTSFHNQTFRGTCTGTILSYSEDRPSIESVMIHGVGWMNGSNWMYVYNNRFYMLRTKQSLTGWDQASWPGPMQFLSADISDPEKSMDVYGEHFDFERGEYPMCVVGFDKFVFFMTWDYIWPASGTPPPQTSDHAIQCYLYVTDLSLPWGKTFKKSLYNAELQKAICPGSIAANSKYFLFNEDSFNDGVEGTSTPAAQTCTYGRVTHWGMTFDIWKHDGDPIGSTPTFVKNYYFSFNSINAQNELYSGYCNFWLNGNTLYCAAQPLKTDGTHRYEIWSLDMDAFHSGSHATLIGVFADNQSMGITDFFVEAGVAYILDRVKLYKWDLSQPVAKMFDFGTAYDYSLDVTADGRSFPAGKKFSLARFPHQVCASINQNYQHSNSGGGWFAPLWSSNFLSCDIGASKSQALDDDGKVWVLLGPFAKNRGEWSEARAFSISEDQFTLVPDLNFDREDGFVSHINISDGAPVANKISFNPTPYTIADQVSELWSQTDSITFPGDEITTIEIPLGGASLRGYGYADKITNPPPSFTVPAPTPIIMSSYYEGNWDASSGSYPSIPTDYNIRWWIISNNGNIAGTNYYVGDWLLNNTTGSHEWTRIDGKTLITSTTRRYMTINGITLWDDPVLQQMVPAEGINRRMTFWGLATKAFLTVDNTGLGAFSLSNCTIYGKAISQVVSNKPAFSVEDKVSERLYKKTYIKDITTPLSNDPIAADDVLRKNSKSRLWLPSLGLPWYPILKPGQEISITDTQQGLIDVPFQVLSVSHIGFQTEVTGNQLHEGDVK